MLLAMSQQSPRETAFGCFFYLGLLALMFAAIGGYGWYSYTQKLNAAASPMLVRMSSPPDIASLEGKFVRLIDFRLSAQEMFWVYDGRIRDEVMMDLDREVQGRVVIHRVHSPTGQVFESMPLLVDFVATNRGVLEEARRRNVLEGWVELLSDRRANDWCEAFGYDSSVPRVARLKPGTAPSYDKERQTCKWICLASGSVGALCVAVIALSAIRQKKQFLVGIVIVAVPVTYFGVKYWSAIAAWFAQP